MIDSRQTVQMIYFWGLQISQTETHWTTMSRWQC